MLGANVTGYALKPKTKPSLFKLAKIDKILEKSIYSDIKDYKKLNYEIKKFKPDNSNNVDSSFDGKKKFKFKKNKFKNRKRPKNFSFKKFKKS